MQEIEEKNRMGKTRDLFKKIRDTKGTYHAKMGIIKDRNSKKLTDIDYTEEVTNRFKGLDLECIMNYRLKFVTLYRRQGSDHPQEKEMQKRKMAV